MLLHLPDWFVAIFQGNNHLAMKAEKLTKFSWISNLYWWGAVQMKRWKWIHVKIEVSLRYTLSKRWGKGEKWWVLEGW